MTHCSDGLDAGQSASEANDSVISLGQTTSIMSLPGVADLLTAMESKLAVLPPPYPLFARELVSGILERMGVGT